MGLNYLYECPGKGAAHITLIAITFHRTHTAKVGPLAEYSLALGHNARAQAANTIILSGEPDGLEATEWGFYVRPIRDLAQGTFTDNCVLHYERATFEVYYDCSGSRRQLEEQEAFEARIVELERKLESALATEARIAELEAQVKALIEKAPAS